MSKFWEDRLSKIYEYITHYQVLEKGIIIADDETGKTLNCVKEQLQFEDLKREGKVSEITIDASWTPYMADPDNPQNPQRCWNKLVEAASKANHGLLVINISNIEIFAHCWSLKQLAKQEGGYVNFNGYVLLVIKGIAWDAVKDYANAHNKGEFDAMMQFYKRVQ